MTANKRYTLYLFVDTNLFIQCRPLEELDWSFWKQYEEVQLIASRPVQREIDSQKNKGNDRIAKRARKTNSIFGQIIDSEHGFKLIQEECPRVTLHLGGPSLPSTELSDLLDYNKTDDELIGCLHKFRQSNPDKDARLLTHDVGPRMTAKSLDLPFISISDSWLSLPESNETEKENARLRQQIVLLRRQEPEFNIKLCNDSEQESMSIEVQCEVYEPLNDQDIEDLKCLLKKRFPLVTDFTIPKACQPSMPFGAVESITLQLRRPPSPNQIARYTAHEYPNWIKDCARVLYTLHNALEHRVGRPTILFSVENRGTRPARDALVEFNALGNFKISPPLDDFPDSYMDKEDVQIDLPTPPKPPIGKSFEERLLGVNRISNYPSIVTPSLVPPRDSLHDPNGFYYKHKFPVNPVDSFSLSCDQWRHGSTGQEFAIEVCFDSHLEQVEGSIECLVQAENLSVPIRERFPITINAVRKQTKDYAKRLILGLRKSMS